jgi:hypothetical protein
VDRSLVDWLTISPKQAAFEQKEGDELKLIFTGGAVPGITPDAEAVRRMAAARGSGTTSSSRWTSPPPGARTTRRRCAR